jgi:hypothetical protein
MIKIMYANHCANDDYISNLYESKVKYVWWKIPNFFLSITNIVSHVEYIDILFFNFHYFMLLTNGRISKNTLENLHKVDV